MKYSNYNKRIQQQLNLIEKSKDNEVGVRKVLFHGDPGTGKTLAAELLSKELGIKMYSVNYSHFFDSKLGNTTKNIEEFMLSLRNRKAIIFFDEIDSIVVDRSSNKDVGEMIRITNTMLNILDKLDKKHIFIAATNMLNMIDKALLRRFQLTIEFGDYTPDILMKIMNEKFAVNKAPKPRGLSKFVSSNFKTPDQVDKFVKSYILYKNVFGTGMPAIRNVLGWETEKIILEMNSLGFGTAAIKKALIEEKGFGEGKIEKVINENTKNN